MKKLNRGRPRHNDSRKQGIGLSLDIEIIEKLDEIASKSHLNRSQIADYIFRQYLGLKLPENFKQLDILTSVNFEKEEKKMNRKYLLAAFLYNYSYANYNNHLGIGNARYDEMMPHDVDVLEQAEKEDWNEAKIAKALDVRKEQVLELKTRYHRAKDIINAPSAADSFRRGIKYSIIDALEQGLNSENDIDNLVTQLCYRAADLGFLLDLEGKELSDYSEELRG